MTAIPRFISDPDPSLYVRGKYVVLDFETTHGPNDKGQAIYENNRIALAVWRSADGRIKVRRAGEYDLAELCADIRAADFVVSHNSKFEIQWLLRCGLDIGSYAVYDTMLAEYVIGGNRWRYNQLALDEICKRRFGVGKDSVVSRMIKRGVPVEDIPARWLERYCIRDVMLTERLFKAQLAEVTTRLPKLLPIIYTRCIVAPVLADIELQGMALDGELVRTSRQRKDEEYAALSAQLSGLMPGVNISSPKQVGAFLYDTLGFSELTTKKQGAMTADRTNTGERRTDADTISKLTPATHEQAQFKDLFTKTKELSNELSKYLHKFDACCSEAGGVLYATFNQCNTGTHRLSSSGLDYRTQLQNLPRAFKKLFKAKEPGWKVGSGDGTQLEFRTAVHLGRDKAGLKDILSGVDVHSVTAKIIECSRQDAKSHTFKPLYGGRKGSKKEVKYYEFFREKYADITDRQNCWVDTVLANKYLETEWGLRFYWPTTRMERSGYIVNREAICNYPVQSFATAEIIPIALVYFWYRCRAEGLRLRVVNTIHDSIDAEFPPEEEAAFRRIMRTAMTNDVYVYLSSMYGITLTVPLGCGIKVADRWGDTGEEEKYEADQALWKTPNNLLLQTLE